MKIRLKTTDIIVIIVLIAVFVFISLFTANKMYNATVDEVDQVSSISLERIRMDFQDTLNTAANALNNYALEADRLVSAGASQELIGKTVNEIKQTQLLKTDGVNFNAYIAGPGWEIIPDFDKPDDYHATERVWYVGAVANKGELFVSEPYLDSMTKELCYTMSKVLSDGKTVVAMDFTLSDVQKSVNRMGAGDFTAIIVSKDLLVVGYTDLELVGTDVFDTLPQYYSVLDRVTSSYNNVSFTDTVNNETVTVFSSETNNQWYMVLIASDEALYGETYDEIAITVLVFLAILIAILVIYIINVRKRIESENIIENRNKFITGLTDELKEPISSIMKLSDSDRLNNSIDVKEDIESIRESSLVLSQKIENISSYSYMISEEAKNNKSAKKNKRDVSKMIRRTRNSIVWLFALTMVVTMVISAISGYITGTMDLTLDLDIYYIKLTNWTNQQNNILDMFTNFIDADPSILKDYDACVAWLDRIASNYPEISVCYIANPYKEHTVIMNNGWEPDDDWHVEDRQWYKDTISSTTGYSISSPYYDDQTGEYCITFSQSIFKPSGEFLGVFGIDFFMDKLIDIFGEENASDKYAFLVDSEGKILNHPNEDYQMTATQVTEVAYTEYEGFASDLAHIGFTDYDGRLATGMKAYHDGSGFTIYAVKGWWDVYGYSISLMAFTLVMLLICTVLVIVMINRIITWQHDVNDKLAHSVEQAAAAGKAKSQFLAQMSHEIRTPINAVIGMDEMILRESKDPAIREYAENIQVAGKTLLELVNGILDFSKIEEGKMEIVPVKYEVAALIGELHNMISGKAEKKKLEMKFDIDPSLPTSLFGDDVKVKQIIINMLTNAVKYTDEGSVILKMTGTMDGDSYMLHVSVKDTGIGIKTEDLDKLFASFQRLDVERNRNIEGTGLGISIIQGLLKRMNSELKVVSEYGKGSEFFFDLEQKIIDRTPMGEFNSSVLPGLLDSKEILIAENCDVLVVDDNDMNLKVAKGLLKFYGIVPDLAMSGDECIKMARAKRYDLIFLDHMMPGKDGIQTFKELVKEDLVYDTPVICLTANAVAGIKEKYIEEGFKDYLAKPIDMKALESILVAWLPEDKLKRVQAEPAAEEVTASEEIKDPVKYLDSVGIDTSAGITYTAGSKEFYFEMLGSFVEGYEEKSAEIRKDHDDKNWPDYQTRVHALKSTSRMIGINDLADMALKHENAAREGRADEIEEGFDELMELYGSRVNELKKALGEV